MKTIPRAGVLLLSALLALPSCSSAPKIEPAFAEVAWRDFERGSAATLVTRGYGDFERRQQAGRLDPSVKLVDPETMGVMVKVLEQYGFFERAMNISPDAPGLADSVPQIISFRDGNQTRTLEFVKSPGTDKSKIAAAKDFVKIKQGLIDIHRNTFSLTIAPSKGASQR